MKPEKINDIEFEEIEFLGRKMLCTCLRVDRSSIPEGLYAYDIRHSDDDWGDPCQIQEKVLVNYYGTIITDEIINMDQDSRGVKYLDFDSNNDFSYTNIGTTICGSDALKYFEDPDSFKISVDEDNEEND